MKEPKFAFIIRSNDGWFRNYQIDQALMIEIAFKYNYQNIQIEMSFQVNVILKRRLIFTESDLLFIQFVALCLLFFN